MRPPFKVRRTRHGKWRAWQLSGANGWRAVGTYPSQQAAVRDIYKRWPWHL